MNMLGERFATVEGEDNSIFRYIEEITKEIEQDARVAAKAEVEGQAATVAATVEKKLILRMRLQLLQLDEKLLNLSIQKISRYSWFFCSVLVLFSTVLE